MSVSKIITIPHQSLRQMVPELTSVDKKTQQVLASLAETLRQTTNPPGVGLAAPQINRSLRVFATQLEDHRSTDPVIRLFANPRITDQADKLVTGVNPRQPDLEGCLSIPDIYGPVLRPEWATLQWQEITPDGQLTDIHTETFFDFTARVMLHELDHLNGVLFTDHTLTQNQPLYRSEKDELIEIDPTIAQGF